MKITLNKNILEQTLAQVNRIIERRVASPVLGCFLMETIDNNQVKLSATNLDITVINYIPCSVFDSGAYCLPTSLIFDITKKLVPNSNISFEDSSDLNTIKVTSNRANFSIHSMESKKFPEIIRSDYYLEFDLKTEDLKEAINIAKVAMSQDSTKIQLNGIYIHYAENIGLRFVSTDLYRIACTTIKTDDIINNLQPLIISRRTISELIYLLDNIKESSTLHIKLSKNQITFEATIKNSIKSVINSRLVGGNFPEYHSALKVQNDKILVANTYDMINTLERVSTVVTDNANSIKLQIKENKLVISAISKEFGKAIDELDVDFNSEQEFQICFNSKYLLELIKQIKTDNLQILFNNSSSPTLIKPLDSNSKVDSIFVIMPVEIISN